MTGDCLYLKILFLFCIQAPLLAQQSNPFEIKDRLPPKIIDTVGNDSLPLDILAVDSSLLVSDTIDLSLYDTVGIPDSALLYDSISEDTIAIGGAVPDLVEEQTLEDTSGKIIESFKQLGRQLPEIEAINNQNLLFIITVLMLLLLATLLAVNRSIVNKAYKAIANDNYLRFLYREYQSMPGLYRLFYIYFFINAGFFLYLVASYYHVTYQSTLILLLGCMIVIGLVYVVKHLVLNILSVSFPIDKEAHLYSFVTMLINILLGMILTPVNLVIAFAPEPFVQVLIWVGLAAIVLLYIFRQLKGLFISGRFLAQYQFHFFLYLCTIEIAPLLIIGKLALGKLGFQ